MSRLLPHPHTVLGYRKDGWLIFPFLGASDDPPPTRRRRAGHWPTSLLAGRRTRS
ncbi:hypothetical protein [Streptomyces sp. PU_AKi4]|uniref:hypothetical protein n=1 Tax=Streptomyces sp. PU_AKi4 TaxID=2800809 RepID=UPI0035244A01